MTMLGGAPYATQTVIITPRVALAIAQTAAYSVLLITTIYILGRDASLSHIFATRSQQFFPLSWLPLLLFTILRILTGALQITTLGNPSPYTLEIGAAVCFSIGLPLLLIATIEILHRVNMYAARRAGYSDVLIVVLDRVLQFVLVVALILYAVAGARAGDVFRASNGASYPANGVLNMAATILTIISFVVFVVGGVGISVLNLWQGFVRERALLMGVYLALPFLLVRLVFAILAHLVGEEQANPVYGSLGLFTGLGFVMEVMAVIFLLAGGFVNLYARRERLRLYGPGSVVSSSRSRSEGTGTESSSRGTETAESEEIVEVYSRRPRR